MIDVQKSALEAELPPPPPTANGNGNEDQRTIKAAETLEKMKKPVEVTIDDELREAGSEVTRELREKQREIINSLDLSKCVSSFFLTYRVKSSARH